MLCGWGCVLLSVFWDSVLSIREHLLWEHLWVFILSPCLPSPDHILFSFLSGCEYGQFCERNTCLPAGKNVLGVHHVLSSYAGPALRSRIARFYYDEEKNGAVSIYCLIGDNSKLWNLDAILKLLRNMCNGVFHVLLQFQSDNCPGMQGENTKTLTYAGKLSDRIKAGIRARAGCIPGYCANLIKTNPEQNPPELNSCDEVG